MSVPLSIDKNLNPLICFQFYSGWREVSGAYNNALERGVTIQHIFILNVLKHYKKISVSNLGEELNLNTSAVSTIVSRMEAKSLIVRTHDSEDRRKVYLTPTTEGLELLDRNKSIFESVSDNLFENISKSDQQTIESIVNRLTKNRESKNQIKQ